MDGRLTDGLTAPQREWLRRRIDHEKRQRMLRSKIDKAEYRIEHGIAVEKNVERLAELRKEVAVAPPSPDGKCLAIINVGSVWTDVLRVRCSRRATTGRFCRTHERRRVGEISEMSVAA